MNIAYVLKASDGLRVRLSARKPGLNPSGICHRPFQGDNPIFTLYLCIQ